MWPDFCRLLQSPGSDATSIRRHPSPASHALATRVVKGHSRSVFGFSLSDLCVCQGCSKSATLFMRGAHIVVWMHLLHWWLAQLYSSWLVIGTLCLRRGGSNAHHRGIRSGSFKTILKAASGTWSPLLKSYRLLVECERLAALSGASSRRGFLSGPAARRCHFLSLLPLQE